MVNLLYDELLSVDSEKKFKQNKFFDSAFCLLWLRFGSESWDVFKGYSVLLELFQFKVISD